MTTAITYVHTRARTTEYCYDVEVNGVLVAAANRFHDAELVALEVEARETITIEGMELHAPAEDPACPCGRGPAIFFVQYPHRVYAYCVECYSDQKHPPLLAQCAAVIRRCLGSTTGAGGIIDELRRVDQALRMEGW